MFLSKITIKNFRLFKEFELILNKGLNLIVGENNSGKTALLDAIRYTLDTTSAEWIRISEEDFYKGEQGQTTDFHIQLKFEDITTKQASVFLGHVTHEDGQVVLYVNLQASLTTQERRGNRLIKTYFKSGEGADGSRIEREIRNFLSATYLKPLRDVETELKAGRGSRLSQILSSFPSLRNQTDNFTKLIQDILTANQNILENEGINASKEAIIKLINQLTFATEQFSPIINIIGNKNFDQMNEVEKNQAFKSILEKLILTLDEDNPLQGLGYNNLLFIATELLLIQQEKEFSLLLVEEPEAHLHPQLQMKLLKFIREQSTNNLQSILTTHSPNLASKAPVDSLIIMAKGKAYPLRKEETQLSSEDYIFLEKFLDVTKSNLFFAKAILIVEGDGENILLPTIAKLLGHPLEDYGVSVVNVGSTAFARYAKIFKRQGIDDEVNTDNWLPVKVACIRDLDLWPDKADSQQKYGFKEYKDGNKHYWKHYHINNGKLEETLTKKQELSGQNVKVFLSDEWTFEYDLAFHGLAEEVYKAYHDKLDGFDELPSDKEENAICIYKDIEAKKGSKTRVAYNLINILEHNYKDEPEQLRAKLPPYIIKAIAYVTKPFDEEKDKVGKGI